MPAMSRGPQSRRSIAVRAVVLLAPAVLVGWWFSTRARRAPSPYDEALDRALAPVMEQRDVKSKLGAASPTQARLLARQLAELSIQYLSPRDLELWQDVRLAVARSSPAACARLWQGGSNDFFGPAVAALGPETLEAYTEMLGRGLALRLEHKPPPEPSSEALARGLAAIAETLPDGERARFEADVKRRELPDARACELFLTLSSGTQKVGPAERGDFLRALAKALELPAR